MPTSVITNIDNGSVALRDEEFRDELLTFGGADVLAAGTILARNTSTLKLQLYVKGGSSNGNGIPHFVLTYPVTAMGAGDIPVRVLSKGVVNKKRLVIDADGNDSNIDGTVIDLLRQVAITPVDVKQLGVLDNQ